MIRIPLDRLARRAAALEELARHPAFYTARCERQGWEPTTPPAELARHEIATELQVELLEVA